MKHKCHHCHFCQDSNLTTLWTEYDVAGYLWSASCKIHQVGLETTLCCASDQKLLLEPMLNKTKRQHVE